MPLFEQNAVARLLTQTPRQMMTELHHPRQLWSPKPVSPLKLMRPSIDLRET